MADPIEIAVPGKVRALMPAFLDRTRADLERLRAAVAAGDARALRNIGHRLRGTAGSYGLEALGEIAGRLEDAARAGDRPAWPKLVAELGEHLSRIRIRYV